MALLERLRTSLQADYDIRESLGRGGMGAVFLATDRALDKPMAIKVLLPELATTRAVERFLREARALAAVKHPRVVQVHRAGEADGLYYYVMELADGETLADRLARGPLTRPELDTLAVDLLSGLEAIHAAGIVHRDVKPSNIFLVDGRAMLGDFGVALITEDDRITATEVAIGTPRYQAPEQLSGKATERTDLYAAGLVLYEACTGRSWRDVAGHPTAWVGVPHRWRGPLHRALESEPEGRWPDAAAFRRALEQRTSLRTRVAATALATTAAAVLLLLLLTDGRPPGGDPGAGAADLAVLPFQVVTGRVPGEAGAGEPCDPSAHVGCRLANLVTVSLGGIDLLHVLPAARVSRLGPAGMAPLDPAIRRSLRSRYVAHGRIIPRGDQLDLTLVVEDSLGQRQPEVRVVGPSTDPYIMADSVALELLRLIFSREVSSFRGLEEVSTGSLDAMREFLHGEYNFHRNAWDLAAEHYRRAVAIDSSFALAEWRLWNVFRWQLTGEEEVHLDSLLRKHGDRLPAVERALLEAEARDPGTDRIDALEELLARYGYVAFLRWLLADELHHRGPLIGRSLEEAVRQYDETAARNPYLGPVFEHSLLALIRLGMEQESRETLDRLFELTEGPSMGDLSFPPLLQQAFLERFEPDRATARRDSLFDLSAQLPAVLLAARFALLFDLPEAQRDLGRRLVVGGVQPANGHTAQGLALMVMGRPLEALAHLDSAEAAAATPADRRQAGAEAAELRVVFPALGLLELPAEERARGRERLRAEVGESSPRSDRAAWALALDACGSGDLENARGWRQRISGVEDTEADRLRDLARACEARADGDHAETLALTKPLLRTQFLPRQRDPFTRTVLHVFRADALEAMDSTEAAMRERYWSDNSDITKVLGGPLQAVEVDWAASPYSDRRRVGLAVAAGDTAAACSLLDRLEWLWTDVEPSLERAREDDRSLAAEVCR